MAPLRSVEEIRNQIGLFERIMEMEQRVFRFAPGITCMVCSETYESPDILITILKHTYCKICITAKLQNDNAHEFIIGILTGRSANSSMLNNKGYDFSENTSSQDSGNETVPLESSDEIRGLPRGYIYPNSKLMPNVHECIGNRERPYFSLRLKAEQYKPTQSIRMEKVQRGIGSMKGPYCSLRMSAKEPRKQMWPVSIISETASNGLTLWSTGHKNSSDEDCLPEHGGKLLQDISDGDYSDSEQMHG